jgi:hypothetical protein
MVAVCRAGIFGVMTDTCAAIQSAPLALRTLGVSWSQVFLLFFALLCCGMTGFPLGAAILREFGASLVNFVLLAVLLDALMQRRPVMLPKSLTAILFLLVLAGCISIYMPLFNPPFVSAPRPPLMSWLLQFMMLLWFAAAIVAWVCLLNKNNVFGDGYRLFFIFLIASACILNGVFVVDALRAYMGVTIIPRSIIDLVADSGIESAFVRPSGFNSEPSHFAIWAAMVWPLLVFSDRSRISKTQRWLGLCIGLLTIVAGLLSLARTFYVVILIQALAVPCLAPAIRSSLRGWRIWGLIGACLAGGAAFLYLAGERILSAFDIVSNSSSIARWNYSLAAIDMGLHYPMTGVGLGGFTSYFGDFSSDFGVASTEILNNLHYYTYQRLTAANMFVRILSEAGVPGLALMLFAIFWPLYILLRMPVGQMRAAVLLCHAGAVLSWMSTDQFAEPASLFGLGLAIHFAAAQRSTAIGFDLGHFLRAARSRARMIMLILTAFLVCAGGAAVVATMLSSPVYQVRADFLEGSSPRVVLRAQLRSVGIASLSQRAQAIMESDALLNDLTTDPRLQPFLCGRIVDPRACGDRLKLQEAMRQSVKAWNLPDTPLLRISALGRDPQAAALLAERAGYWMNQSLTKSWLDEVRKSRTVVENALRTRQPWGQRAAADLMGDVLVQQAIQDARQPLMIPIGASSAAEADPIWPQPLYLWIVFFVCGTVFLGIVMALFSLAASRGAEPSWKG